MFPDPIDINFSFDIGTFQCQGDFMIKICKNQNCMVEFESNDRQKVYCTPRCRHEYVAREWYQRKKNGMSRLPFILKQPKIFRVDNINGDVIIQPDPIYTDKKMDGTLPDSFLQRIRIDKDTGCYLWTGKTKGKGYGAYGVDVAHRFVWEWYNGVIPAGLMADHRCRTRLCVNIEHLRLVTHSINNTENSNSFSAKLKERTHCKNGHEFIGDNFYIDVKHGGRRCRLCQSKYSKQRRNKEVSL